MPEIVPPNNNYQWYIDEAKRSLDGQNLPNAIDLLRQGSLLAQRRGDTINQGVLLNNLALLQKSANQISTACNTAIHAVRLLEHNDTLYLAEALVNLGSLERDLSDLDSAILHHKAALAIFEGKNDSHGIASALIELGLDYKDSTRLTEAHASLEQALSMTSEEFMSSLRAHAWIGLGLVYEKLNDINQAEYYYLESLKAYRQARNQENDPLLLHELRKNEATLLFNLGRLYDNQEKFETALSHYEQAMEIFLDMGYKLGIADSLSSLGAILQTIGDLNHAKSLHEQALILQREIADLRGQVWTLCDLGIIARKSQEFTEAERNLKKALKISHKIGDPQELYELYFNLGDVHMMANQTNKALDDYKLAAKTIESIRARLLKEKEALGYFGESRIEVYPRLVYLYATVVNDLKQALLWHEHSKSREFLRHLSITEISTKPHQQVPDDLLAQESNLIRLLREAAQYISAAGTSDHLKRIKNYQSIEDNLQILWSKIQKFDAEYVSMRRGEPVSWQWIKQCITT